MMTRDEVYATLKQAIEYGRSTVPVRLAYDQLVAHDAEQRQVIEQQAQKIARLENGLGCSRSHPHEDMNQICELRTEVARLNNELSQRTNLEGSAPCWNSAHMKQIATLREALKFYSGPGVPFDEDYETRDYEDGSSRGVIVKFGKVARQALKETTK
jgi:hypothetical protein